VPLPVAVAAAVEASLAELVWLGSADCNCSSKAWMLAENCWNALEVSEAVPVGEVAALALAELALVLFSLNPEKKLSTPVWEELLDEEMELAEDAAEF